MNTWVEAPPPRKGLGCFGRGCLILLVFVIVLGIACFAGMYWGLHRHSALFYGSYWLAKTRSIAEASTSVPEFSASDQQIQLVQERWQEFEQKTRASQAAEIELSADDINALIATSEAFRGKVFASIDRNLLRWWVFADRRLFWQTWLLFIMATSLSSSMARNPWTIRSSAASPLTANRCRLIS